MRAIFQSQSRAGEPEVKKGTGLLVVCLLFFVVVIFRIFVSIGIPAWGWDERPYLLAAELLSTGEEQSRYVNALYPFIMQAAFLYKDNLLVAAQALNAVLISTAVFPIYFLAGEFLSRNRAIVAAAFGLWLGHNTIAGHVMTENILFPMFWLCCWLYIRSARFLVAEEYGTWKTFVTRFGADLGAFGASLGLFFHVTPKYMPLYIAVSIAFLSLPVVATWRGERRDNTGEIKKYALAALFIVAITVVVLMVVNKLLMGTFLPSLSGIYGNVASKISIGNLIGALRTWPKETADVVIGHIAITGVFLALPIVFSLFFLADAVRERNGRDATLAVVAWLLVAGYFAQNLLFTFMFYFPTTQWAPAAFGRYHYFVYPFFLIMALVWYEGAPVGKARRVLIGVFWVGIVSAAYYTHMSGASLLNHRGGIANADYWYINYPFLYKGFLIIFVVLSGAQTLGYRSRGLGVAIVVYLFAFSTVSNISMAKDLAWGTGDGRTQCYHLRRAFTHEKDNVRLISYAVSFLKKKLLFLPHNTRLHRYVKKGTQLTDEHLPKRFDYVLAEGEFTFDFTRAREVAKADHCALFAPVMK